MEVEKVALVLGARDILGKAGEALERGALGPDTYEYLKYGEVVEVSIPGLQE